MKKRKRRKRRGKKDTRIYVIAALVIAIVALVALLAVAVMLLLKGRKAPEPPQQWGETEESQESGETQELPTDESKEKPHLQESQEDEKIPELDSDLVFAGKNSWLFYKATGDGDTMADYYGENMFSDAELEKIKDSLLKEKKSVEASGAKFVLLIIPNKEVVYDIYMPADMVREKDISRTDILVDYLKENTDLDIIYMKDKFRSMREDDVLIYYKTDTHWNMRGCYVALQEFMQFVYGKSRDISEITFQEHMHDFAGDLVAKGGLGSDYSIDTVYFLGKDQVLEEEKVEESVLLVGDSFAEFLKMEMEYYFEGGVIDGNVEGYDYNFYKATSAKIGQKPDIVLWECCERHIARLGMN